MDSGSLHVRQPASFGALLKRHRLAAGLSQEALAERARLSARAISAYERGLRRAPYRDTLRLLTQALDLSVEETATLQAAVPRRRGPKAVPRPPHAVALTLEATRTNLPVQLSSFVGRRRELAEVKQLLARTRLLTLTGTGGCGKTRLAFRAAEGMLDHFPDGVWLVDLAPLTDDSLVIQAVATALGVREEPGQPLPATLLAALRARRLLLILDNCEHLLDACARLCDTLLRACPHLRILATSREALGIAGEIRWLVPPLATPAPEPPPPLEWLTKYESVQLFVDRARAVRPGFAVAKRNAMAVAQICWRLDGIPLAIELAAARVRVLTLDQIAARLDDRFHLLTGSRTALPRHQTLRATIDWSYQLLSDAERVLLRRLSVFAGGWTLEAAEAVCGDWSMEHSGDETTGSRPSGETRAAPMTEALSVEIAYPPPPVANPASAAILDLLTALVDKSWVIAEGQEGEERYRLLETIRQYAGEKLLESGDADDVLARYRAWYQALAERAASELSGPRQRLWLDRLEREHDNLRAVLEGSLADPSCLERAGRMVAALLRLWIVRGYLSEGRRLLTAVQASAASVPADRRSRARTAALYVAGFAAYFQGDFTAAASLAEEWLAMARDLGDERGIWLAIDMLARAVMNQWDYQRASALFVDELAAMRRLRDRFGVCSGLVGLAVLARLQGSYEQAVALCDECLALSREAGDLWFIGQALSNLGLTRYQQGHYGLAREQFAEALAQRRALRDRSGIAWSLINLGDAEQAQGSADAARARFEESLAILRDLGDRSGSADALASLGRVAQAQRDFAAARACYVESLALRRDLGHRLAMPALLEGLAGLAAAQGRPARALTLAGAADALRDRLGAPQSPADREQVETWLGPVRAALGEAAAGAWAGGRAMTLEHAEMYALNEDVV